MPHRTCPGAIGLALGLALVTTSLLAPDAAAQGRSAEDARIIDSYRLTMPVLRSVLPALHAPGAQSCPRDRSRDPHSMSIADMVAMLERCAPVVQSLQRAGVSVRDGAIVFASMLRTGKAVALQSGNASAVAPGVLRDNALLLERNDPELKRLTRTGAPS
jgi:hypothetical protein